MVTHWNEVHRECDTEIERLRKALKEIIDIYTYGGRERMAQADKIARAALDRK